MSSNKNALLVSFFFPPNKAVGSLRPAYLAQYLPAYGWDVTVLSARVPGGTRPSWASVLETDYTDVVAQTKRMMGLAPSQSTYAVLGEHAPSAGHQNSMSLRQLVILNGWRLVTYPDAMRGWYRHLVSELNKTVANQKFDAIISTSPPVTTHLAVRRANRRFIPWIADLRDLWADNPYHQGRLRRSLDAILESRTLSAAAALVTVSDPLAQVLQRRFPSKPTWSIPNAFDAREWETIPFKAPEKCELVYAGQMRDPSILFQALLEEVKAGAITSNNFSLNLFTEPTSWLLGEIERFSLEPFVHIRGVVERSEVMRAERNSTANIVISSFRKGEEAGYTAKLFEYLGARRPIIGIGPNRSVIGELLAKIAGCWYASNVEQARLAVRGALHNWETDANTTIPFSQIEQFSAEHLASRFARVLEQVTSPEPTRRRQ